MMTENNEAVRSVPSLPQEIVDLIVSYLPVDFTDCSYIDKILPGADADSTRAVRKNPIHTLKRLTRYPMRLMEIMLATDSFLTGSAIVGYFFPGRDVETTSTLYHDTRTNSRRVDTRVDHEWVFVIGDDANKLLLFYLTMAKIQISFKICSADGSPSYTYDGLPYFVIPGVSESAVLPAKVCLVVVGRDWPSSSFPSISDMTTNCAITGSTAACLDYTREKVATTKKNLYSIQQTVRDTQKNRNIADTGCYSQPLPYIYNGDPVLTMAAVFQEAAMSGVTWKDTRYGRYSTSRYSPGFSGLGNKYSYGSYAYHYLQAREMVEAGILSWSSNATVHLPIPRVQFPIDTTLDGIMASIKGIALANKAIEDAIYFALFASVKIHGLVSYGDSVYTSTTRLKAQLMDLPWHFESTESADNSKNIHDFDWWYGIHVVDNVLHCVVNSRVPMKHQCITGEVGKNYLLEYGRYPTCNIE